MTSQAGAERPVDIIYRLCPPHERKAPAVFNPNDPIWGEARYDSPAIFNGSDA
jgi:hypothetical protein